MVHSLRNIFILSFVKNKLFYSTCWGLESRCFRLPTAAIVRGLHDLFHVQIVRFLAFCFYTSESFVNSNAVGFEINVCFFPQNCIKMKWGSEFLHTIKGSSSSIVFLATVLVAQKTELSSLSLSSPLLPHFLLFLVPRFSPFSAPPCVSHITLIRLQGLCSDLNCSFLQVSALVFPLRLCE
jgi:hypothetical protein